MTGQALNLGGYQKFATSTIIWINLKNIDTYMKMKINSPNRIIDDDLE